MCGSLLYKSLLKHLCSTQSIHCQQVHKYKHIQIQLFKSSFQLFASVRLCRVLPTTESDSTVSVQCPAYYRVLLYCTVSCLITESDTTVWCRPYWGIRFCNVLPSAESDSAVCSVHAYCWIWLCSLQCPCLLQNLTLQFAVSMPTAESNSAICSVNAY